MKKYLLLFILSGLFYSTFSQVDTSDFNYFVKEYDTYIEEEKNEFEKYKEERDKEFEEFLKTDWENYQLCCRKTYSAARTRKNPCI